MTTPPPSRLALDLACVRVLVQRDVIRFFRQASRVVGALLQPLIFWFIIGGGMAGSFRVPGAESITYPHYFFPGTLVLVVLFTSIFTTMSVIEDRQQGFLQAVLVAPASRFAVVLGKTLGGVTIAMAQAALFLVLAPIAGYPLAQIQWPLLFATLLLTGVGLAALGFAIAWWLDSTPGYHVIMNVLLVPAWVVSGAMFPAGPSTASPGWLAIVTRGNPLAYCVSATRRALGGGDVPPAIALPGSSALLELAVAAVFAVGSLALASHFIDRRLSGRARRTSRRAPAPGAAA